jgi:hypothetical protein
MKNGIFALGVLAFATLSQAETTIHMPAKKASAKGNYLVKSVATPAPDVNALWKQFREANAKDSNTSPEAARKVASSGSRITGSEDLMSAPLKTFRDKLIAVKDAETLDKILTEYDANYDKAEAAYPNDLKYVIARFSPLLSMRGFFWRMAPLAHQAAVTQESLLGMVRSFAEQIMIYEPDTQWPAYMAFLAIPSARLLTPSAYAPKDGKERKDARFEVENDLPDFLANEVYPRLTTACNRLQNLKMSIEIDGKSSPIVFDNQIRFGQNAFSNFQYDATDRFKIVGDAERYAGIARFSRRMAMIAQLSAYNWNGNIALREAIGKKYGIDATVKNAASGITSMLTPFTGGGNGAYNMEGITREERVVISNQFPNVFQLRSKAWMPVAYYNLHNYAYYSMKAWGRIRKESDEYNFLLDPDLSQGRRDQIDKSVRNLASLLPDPQANGSAPVAQGSITGKTAHVDMKAFFNNPPENLHYLMPSGFAHQEDLKGLEKEYAHFNAPANNSIVKMKIGETPVEWRNYLYGRAISWDLDDKSKYAALFPDSKSGTDVADAQRVLSEMRGGRPLLNTLVIFVK